MKKKLKPRQRKLKYRLKVAYYGTISWFSKLSDVWYAFACWGWRRHTTIKPRWLNHKWTDKSEIMIYMIFELLCRFVEDELLVGQYENLEDPANKEILALYKWWTEEYIGSDQDYTCFGIKGIGDDSFMSYYDPEQNIVLEKCKQVIALSPHMWT